MTINLHNITIRRGKNILLKSVNWNIYPKQRIGIIGKNGSGKSTLFSVLLNEYQPDTGEIDIAKHIKFSHVAQEVEFVNQSALDFVLDGDKELRRLEADLKEAEQMNDGERIAKLHEKLSIIDAYTAPARAAQLLSGLGFSQGEEQQSVKDFSGGWRVRLNLAKALMCRSDVLLLDEPTNHLDLDAILWLEQWLIKYSGTLLLISHDRDFLDQTVNYIAYLSDQRLKIVKGNYSAFERSRAAEILLQQTVYDKQQKKLAHMQAFVDRFRYKATKSHQAQSRLKAIKRMELVSAVQSESVFQFEFKTPKECQNPLLVLNDITMRYGEKTILQHVHLSIRPKQRIGILGPNGAGKSTLIKILAGELLSFAGKREVSSGLKIGYFAQHQIDQLNLFDTPLSHLKKLAEGKSELDLRKFLGSFGFSHDNVFEPIKNFSGGEKSRLALALLIWQQPNLLLLDEPTNHLDLEMRNALSLALQTYEGSMILVSHDRFLVKTTTDELLLVADKKVENFMGDLTDYQLWLFNFRKNQKISLNQEMSRSDISRKEKRQLLAKKREIDRPLLLKIKGIEQKLNGVQKELDQIELKLLDKSLYEVVNKEQLKNYLATSAVLKKQINELESAWLAANEQHELSDDER